ncbi:MAG: amino acid ABC transporter permease [Bacilli bacterium]|nr:amino acid ABC transporter permease [Bacilli bacterium]
MNWANKFEVFWNSICQENFQQLILKGLFNTLLIAVMGLIIGIIVGTLLAICKVAPKYKLGIRILDKLATAYIAIFRGTPIVVQLLLAYYVLLPALGIKGVDPLVVGIIVFGLNSAAYVAEIMRGGLNSVDPGQMEAGRALGLSYKTTMIKIVIPQAIKNILPTLGNEFITLIKETSVVSFITVVDLYTAFNTIGTNTYSVVVPYIVMALIYIVLIVIITVLVKLMEKGLAKSDRSN